jgi:hypothetical protein
MQKRRIKWNTFNSQYPLSISIAMKDEKKSQLEIFWTVEVSRFCTIHAVTNEKKSNVI